MTINDFPSRLKQITINEGISVRQLEIIIGCSNGLLSKCILKGTDISTKWVSKIIELYPKYNAEWLLTGKSTMLKYPTETGSTPQVIYSKSKLKPDNDNEKMLLQKECNDKGNRIIKLLDENAALRKELEEIKKATE